MNNILFLKKFLLIIFCVVCGVSVFAFDAELEQLLYSSPNIDASEFVLVLNNDLDKTISYLTDIRLKIDALDEPYLYKKIRHAHTHYLLAYSYIYHDSNTIKKNDAYKLSREQIDIAASQFRSIIIERPKYSDAYRVLSVNLMLSGNTGFNSMFRFLNIKEEAFTTLDKALELNPNNVMARVTRNNFDCNAPRIVGANPERGYDIIMQPLPDGTPKPFVFETIISRIFALKNIKNQEQVDILINELKTMYPNAWKIATLK